MYACFSRLGQKYSITQNYSWAWDCGVFIGRIGIFIVPSTSGSSDSPFGWVRKPEGDTVFGEFSNKLQSHIAITIA